MPPAIWEPLAGARRLLFATTTLAFAVGIVEGISYIALAVLSRRLDEPVLPTSAIYRDQSAQIQTWLTADSGQSLLLFDPVLGWRLRPGYQSSLYTIGSQGVRGAREYTSFPPPGVLRTCAFGDSYVFGTEVPDSSAWPAVVERAEPSIEVLNFGVAEYGVDQTLLALSAHAAELHPQIVLVGFTPPQLGRAVNVYRRFLSTTKPPLVKPRFLLTANSGLTPLPTPFRGMNDYRRLLEAPKEVRTLGAHDSWYSPLIYQNPLYDYSAFVRLLTTLWLQAWRQTLGPGRLYVKGVANPRSEAFRLTAALFLQAADTIRRRGAEPLFVFFPDRVALSRVQAGLPPSYEPLLDTLRGHGLYPLDASEAFRGIRPGAIPGLFATAHYSVEGNRIVGLWLGERLRELASSTTPSPPSPRSP